jgi:uncharacterized protein (UPF0276 family)
MKTLRQPDFFNRCALPQRGGLGLKPQHVDTVLSTRPSVGFFEVHAENYMVAGGPLHHYLTRIRADYPLSIHGVGLSIGGEAALDESHLARLSQLIDRYQPESFSEHLAWSSHHDVFYNDLLPAPYHHATLSGVCDHIDQVQTRLRRQMLLENPATYVAFSSSTLDEGEFLSEVIKRTGCGLLLDVNNAYLSCLNHHRDCYAYLESLPLFAVGEIHLAGFAEDSDAAGAPLLIDTHGAPVADAVWALYQWVIDQLGAKPTLIERDQNLPEFSCLLAEAQRAEYLMSRDFEPHTVAG